MKYLLSFCLLICILIQGKSQQRSYKSYLELVKSANIDSDSLKYNAAISKWSEIIKSNPVNGEFWCKLADAYYGNKEWSNAINAYQQAIKLGFAMRWIWALPIAESYAKLESKDSCYSWIKNAIALGYPSLDPIKADTILKKYYSDNKFKDLLWMKDRNSMTRTEGWNYDLNYLWWQIQRIHYKPYTKYSKEQFISFVEKIRKEIPHANDLILTAEFMKLVAMVSDGHSMVKTWDFKEPRLTKRIPLRFDVFKDGVFVVSADSLHTPLIGEELLEIDHVAINEILQKESTYIGRENDMWLKTMQPNLLSITALLYGMGLIKDPESCTLTLKDINGKITQEKMNTIPSVRGVPQNYYYPQGWKTIYTEQNNVLSRQNSGDPYWYKYIPEKKAVYFKYSEVENKNEQSFSDFTSNLFNFINGNEVSKLIIDVRENGGGNTMLLPPFLQAILKCDKINKKGNLFCLTGKKTFSAAQNFTDYLELYTNVIIAGEPTGSSPNFVGEVNFFKLPYSEISCNISNLYWQVSYPEDNRIWTTPTIYYEPLFKDILQRKDPLLQSILDIE